MSLVTGQNVQFLVRLEETLAEADPLLGWGSPLTPEFFQVRLEGEGGSSSLWKSNRRTGEAGGFRFNHVFARSGEWKLLFEFEDTNNVQGSGELIIPAGGGTGQLAPAAVPGDDYFDLPGPGGPALQISPYRGIFAALRRHYPLDRGDHPASCKQLLAFQRSGDLGNRSAFGSSRGISWPGKIGSGHLRRLLRSPRSSLELECSWERFGTPPIELPRCAVLCRERSFQKMEFLRSETG